MMEENFGLRCRVETAKEEAASWKRLARKRGKKLKARRAKDGGAARTGLGRAVKKSGGKEPSGRETSGVVKVADSAERADWFFGRKRRRRFRFI